MTARRRRLSRVLTGIDSEASVIVMDIASDFDVGQNARLERAESR